MNRPYAESFALLRERVELPGDFRSEVSRPPRHDDERPGPSIFKDCSFRDADLRDADLRRSKFQSCNFTGSRLGGCKVVRPSWLSRAFGDGLRLSREQEAEVTWSDLGPEPEGG